MWFACKSTGDSTGGRAHNPLSLSVVDRGAGKKSVFVSGDEDEGEAHPHLSHATASVKRARANGDKRARWMENSTTVFSLLV